MIEAHEGGGLKAIDFHSMNGVIKLKWLQSFINNESSYWLNISKSLFKTFGGIKFLLLCDFEISKLHVKLSAFHQQVWNGSCDSSITLAFI